MKFKINKTHCQMILNNLKIKDNQYFYKISNVYIQKIRYKTR